MDGLRLTDSKLHLPSFSRCHWSCIPSTWRLEHVSKSYKQTLDLNESVLLWQYTNHTDRLR